MTTRSIIAESRKKTRQTSVLFRCVVAQMLISPDCHDAAARRSQQESGLKKIRFIDILDRPGVLADRRGERLESYRSAAELQDHGLENAAVQLLESELVDFQQVERFDVGLILILLLSVLCLVCGVLSCFVKVKDYKSFEKIQIIVISIMVLFIAAAVFILEQQFPSDL